MPITVGIVEPGVYESLLTARLHQALNASTNQVSDLKDVDEAEQPQAIARHLGRLIERSLKGARTADARIAMVRDILSVLPNPELAEEALYAEGSDRIKRLEAVMPAGITDSSRYVRPATPLSDTALMTNSRDEPTLAGELRAELASADKVDLLLAFVKWQGLRRRRAHIVQTPACLLDLLSINVNAIDVVTERKKVTKIHAYATTHVQDASTLKANVSPNQL